LSFASFFLVQHICSRLTRPEFIQDSLSDTSEGRNVASVTKLEDAGHMVCSSTFPLPFKHSTDSLCVSAPRPLVQIDQVVQEQPKELAVALMKILQTVFKDEVEDRQRMAIAPTITTKL
jgi:hypothetical protein